MSITRAGNTGIYNNEKFAYSFEISGVERSEVEQLATEKQSQLDWQDNAFNMEGFTIVPFGANNNLPIEIRNTVNDHNLAPRIFTKKKFLLWGEGPFLYKTVNNGTGPVRQYQEDQEVESWLESFDHIAYLRKAIDDFNYSEGVFTKIFTSKGRRIGNSKIARIEHEGVHKSRLGYPQSDTQKPPTHILVANWHKSYWPNQFKAYPLFNKTAPGKHGVSMHYAQMHAFGSDYYPRPDVVGSLAWIRRSTAIPFILEALTNNSLNVKWHIISPAKYWEEKEEKLRENCTAKGEGYKPKMIEDLKDEVFTQLGKVLAGQDNVGKFFQSEAFIEVVGATAHTHKWEILPIDQKIKDFVDAQLAISKHGDTTTTGGLGLHQALSYISADGNSDSGSEQLYAYKNHILSEVTLPEAIICEAINIAIKINWPEKKLKLGFYRTLPEREEDITSSNRIANAV